MYNYDPATISPCELPIHRRVNYHSKCGERFWNIKSAKDYCLALCGLPDTSLVDLTHEEWKAVAAVANGGIWPIPNHPYTNENWHDDESFNAVPGQEVTEEIYEDMFDVLPPYRLPRCKRTAEYTSGFMVSEAAAHDLNTGKALYSAFGKSGDKYYYIGLLPCRPAE